MSSNKRMDIKSMLSPQDSPAPEHRSPSSKRSTSNSPALSGTSVEAARYSAAVVPPSHSAAQGAKRSKKDALIHQAIASPLNLSTPVASSSSLNSNGSYFPAPQTHSQTSSRGQRSLVNSPTTDAPQARPSPAPLQQRHPTSSSSLDTLADLASMQRHHRQNSREKSSSFRSTDFRDQTHASPQLSPLVLSRIRASSIVSTMSDHGTGETPNSLVHPRRFSCKSLSSAELEQMTALTRRLVEDPWDYTSHAQLLGLLHSGFVNHASAAEDDAGPVRLQDYELLADLRQAREAMSVRFPVGEALWLEWMHDEALLAVHPDQQAAVVELCKRAIEEEAGSSQLWRFYGDWMTLLWKTYHGVDWTYSDNHMLNGPVGQRVQSISHAGPDKSVGCDMFSLDRALQVWQHGARACQWHIGDSNLVCLPYLEMELYILSRNPSPGKIHHVGNILTERLRLPQGAWEKTFEIFSGFVSEYDNKRYEERMVSVNAQASKAKVEWDNRESFESRLESARTIRDQTEEWKVLNEYFEFEATQSSKRGVSSFGLDLQLGLCERANLLFPTDADLWEDHVDIALDNKLDARYQSSLLARATKHCPWSGNLWTKRIIALEAAQEDFQVLEDVKHHATSSGLLENVGGIDELIKVYVAWCGFLRRRAFNNSATEDEVDIAEVGIRSAMDSIKEVGEKKFGRSFKSDPQFRVEKIYFKFLAQTGGVDDGRKFWHQLTLTHGDSYEFWERYYLWEMTLWGKELGSGPSSESTPGHATSCLQRAIRRPNLDWPERMIDLYLHHCAQHESVQKLQEAQVECRKATKLVARRRAKDAEEAAQHAAVEQQHHSDQAAANHVDQTTNTKRKRDDEASAEASSKKQRHEDALEQHQDHTSCPTAEQTVKRDRENTLVIVRNIPADCKESRVKQFFKDCGEIVNLKLALVQGSDEFLTATIEFESKEDALSAQTKDMKKLNGQEIRVVAGTGATLWVTNYPPESDEDFMRQLFAPYGEVVEVRFPSLRLNTHRRFCYVQFPTPDQALAATELDGKAMSGSFRLSVKISDPSIRHDRSGAMEEGREIFVGQLDYATTEDELKQLFSEFGEIESLRIPKKVNGQSKGTAFIRFNTKEAAENATLMNLKTHRDRILKVSISVPNKGNKKVASIINATSVMSDSASLNGSTGADHRSRTLLIENIPDTVNDARIKAVCEKYGTVKKLTLRPGRGDGFVEFETVADAGKAMMGLAGFEITPGHALTVKESMESSKGSDPSGQGSAMGSASQIGKHTKLAFAAPVSRPRQPGQKKRGGLSFVRATQGREGTGKNEGTDAKSQDQFRAMMEGGQES